MDILTQLEEHAEIASDLQLVMSMFPSDIEAKFDGGNLDVLITCRPKTAGDSQKEFVFCVMSVTFDLKGLVNAKVLKSCGVSDSRLSLIETAAKKTVAETIPGSILFDIVEFVNTVLTEANEEGDCCICLSPLVEASNGTIRGSCWHSFHLNCLVEWFIREKKDKMPCPVCRCDLHEVPGLSEAVAQASVSFTDKSDDMDRYNPAAPIRVLDLSQEAPARAPSPPPPIHKSKLSNIVIVSHLTPMTNNRLIRRIFEPLGAQSARVIYRNGRSIGFGYAVFSCVDDAERAAAAVDGQIVRERPIHAAVASEKDLQELGIHS